MNTKRASKAHLMTLGLFLFESGLPSVRAIVARGWGDPIAELGLELTAQQRALVAEGWYLARMAK